MARRKRPKTPPKPKAPPEPIIDSDGTTYYPPTTPGEGWAVMTPTIRIPSHDLDADHNVVMQHLHTKPEIFVEALRAQRARVTGGETRAAQLRERAQRDLQAITEIKNKRRDDEVPRLTDEKAVRQYLETRDDWKQWKPAQREAEVHSCIKRVRRARANR
jgi:hypothetical protein